MDKLFSTVKNEPNLPPPPRPLRGKLKIFLGYARGVGKSYAMLEAGLQRLTEGLDVIIGWIETYSLSENEALLKEMEKVSGQIFLKAGNTYREIDVDQIIKRAPQLVLVDDLASGNPPDARHPYRYQDVEEILIAGIDVYATLNIQHLESLNIVIKQITGYDEKETIPNTIFDQAEEIELIDLAPDELYKRFKTGKVFFPAQEKEQFEQFYRKGNLSALRELALRYAADRVDIQMLHYMEEKSIHGPWPVRDRILVTISSHPLGEHLIRSAYQLSKNIGAEWTVLYVENPQIIRESTPPHQQIARTMALAESLGANTVTISGTSISQAILDYALKHNFNKILVGKPYSRNWLRKFHQPILNELIRDCGSIDIYIISGNDAINRVLPGRPKFKKVNFRAYVFSVLIVALTTLISLVMRQTLDPVNLVMPYLAVVVVTAFYFGRGPSTVASLLGVLAFDFFFTEPRLTLNISDSQYLLTFFGLLAVGVIISNLTARVREQVEAIQKKQVQTHALFSLSKDLTAAVSVQAMENIIVDHLCQTIGKNAAIYLEKDGVLEIHTASPAYLKNQEKENIALLTFKNGKACGMGTDTFPSNPYRFQPLRTRQGVLGVLAVELTDLKTEHQTDQYQLVEAFSNLSAIAIERSILDAQAKENQILRESEHLKSALLNSVSHDFRTPLASIIGVLDSLHEVEISNGESLFLDQDAKLDLLQTAMEEAHRLNLLVQNLLDMTRLEGNALKLRQDETDLRDLISTAISRMQIRLQNRTIQVNIPDDIPGVYLDFILIEQVFFNILDNTIKYSEPDTPIEINVRQNEDQIEISIADRGIGIPEEALNDVFNKFFRIEQNIHSPGTGLGLSICKGIIDAHHGTITAHNRPGGGTIITIILPIYPNLTEEI